MLMLSSSARQLTTCFHLIRHGEHGEFGRLLSGRAGTSSLSATGRAQADAAAAACDIGTIAAVHASPRKRTMETASIIAARHGLDVIQSSSLDEIEFGSWNGRSFSDLEDDPTWQQWNSHRSSTRCPDGETMGEAVQRAVNHLDHYAQGNPGQTLLCVTHCDIIRGVLAHYLGLSLDNLLRFEIAPGSISTVVIGAHGGCVTRLNEVPA